MTKPQAYEFLKDINIAVLATVSPENKPHTATMYYVVDEALVFYFISQTGTQKYQHIQKNNNVSIVITNRRSVQTIQVAGTAEMVSDAWTITDVVERMSRVNVTNKSTYWPPPISKVQSGEMVIFKVIPTWMRFGDFTKVNEQEVFSPVSLD